MTLCRDSACPQHLHLVHQQQSHGAHGTTCPLATHAQCSEGFLFRMAWQLLTKAGAGLSEALGQKHSPRYSVMHRRQLVDCILLLKEVPWQSGRISVAALPLLQQFGIDAVNNGLCPVSCGRYRTTRSWSCMPVLLRQDDSSIPQLDACHLQVFLDQSCSCGGPVHGLQVWKLFCIRAAIEKPCKH